MSIALLKQSPPPTLPPPPPPPLPPLPPLPPPKSTPQLISYHCSSLRLLLDLCDESAVFLLLFHHFLAVGVPSINFFWGGGAGVFFDVRIYSRILNRIQMRMAWRFWLVGSYWLVWGCQELLGLLGDALVVSRQPPMLFSGPKWKSDGNEILAGMNLISNRSAPSPYSCASCCLSDLSFRCQPFSHSFFSDSIN